MSEYKQKLTITLESENSTESTSIEYKNGIEGDDNFWLWFRAVWIVLGMNFVTEGIENEK